MICCRTQDPHGGLINKRGLTFSTSVSNCHHSYTFPAWDREAPLIPDKPISIKIIMTNSKS